MSVFQTVKANISGNPLLYPVQISAYEAALAHYKEFQDAAHRETLIVMPTGSGKTGVMSLLPFDLSNGKVLIITPGKIVRKTVFKHFDSSNNPEQTFWTRQNVILDEKRLPQSYLYKGFNPKNAGEKDRVASMVKNADIIVTNVHKLGSSNEEVNLMKLVDPDFFDMIIIDEAHHVAASMWQDALDYFKATKVIKLTATPFRADKQIISTHDYDPIFEYSLGEAINDGLIKNIVKQEDIPGQMTFIDQKTQKVYSLEEAKEELGNDFVSKSIALSESCSKEVIEKTKEILNMKRSSYPHHQVLAVTCNDTHAQQVCQWFEELGFKASYVSTRSLSERDIEQRLTDFSNGVYDVMVSIQMLGEGYDNPNISVISLFRPFKSLGPYAQAIGRGLRKINAENLNDIDNFCNVVYHQELNLEKLWDYYKEQETFGQIIKRQREDITEQLSLEFDEIGYVEKIPSGTKSSGTEEEDFSSISVSNVFSVSDYASHGLGKEDAFTNDGIQAYQAAQQQIIDTQQKALDALRESMRNLVATNQLTEEQADLLIQNHEQEAQNKINQNYEDFHDVIITEMLRKDYTNWLNIRSEEFFKASLLSKEGFELYDAAPAANIDKVNNVGYIIKNIHQSLFQETGKNVSIYNAADFAHAKSRVVEKIDFWLKRYGKKEELE
jgi:superfamily II DNA or RNA helicase